MTSPTIASLDAIRAQFPALARREGDAPVAYFDGPGGTQVPRTVVDAMTYYLLHHNANTHWAYPTSVETDALLAQARAALADFLGAGPDEIAFGSNMTTLLFHIARAIGRQLQPGDEIIVTELDHHANVAPWQALARERGVVLKWLPLDVTTFRHEAGALARLLSPRTKVVAIGAASNMLGTISDVPALVAEARAAGALTVVDAVHYAPHALVDAVALDADFVLCSAYKFYGPHVGVVYGRASTVASLDLPRLEPAPDWVPECLETGTQNHEGIVGAAAAVEFLASLSGDAGAPRRERLAQAMTGLHERGEALLQQLWEGLQAMDGVTLYGPPPGTPRTPTLSFRVHGMPSEDVARALAPRGVYVSHGDFYATTVARRLGVAEEGLVRAGCACYTTADEISRLLDGVAQLKRGVR
ncbi:MAG: cysteine desulfurase-like protein [Gemmatimonadaceae bacterium]|nr:cysteine desulfurase-like protein [Gemmatimonadaceae bacterium]